ncbi:MAG TPA: PAS domain-containing protein [Terriglobales bacterium]|nr:PAS domain-containing protein [Terriglobales bacterium]
MIRVQLPTHLRTLAKVNDEVTIEVESEATQRSVLDRLEACYPMLVGTMRDPVSQQRRPFLRFLACETDLSRESPDSPLPDGVISGTEPFKIIGAPAGGQAAPLPLHTLSQADVTDSVISEVVPSASPERKHRGSVLVIADECTSLKSLFAILTEDGYAVHEWQLDLRSQLPFSINTMPDVVLIDVRKPGLDGYRVCASLKNDPATRAIPVIFIGWIDRPINQAKALVSGAVDYVTDPFDPQEVLWRIETHVSLRRLRENLKAVAPSHGAQAVATDNHLERAFQEIQILTQVTGRKHAEEKVRQAARELKKTEEALQSSERNLAGIINTIPTAAWTTRPDGYCDFLNQVWLDYAGMTAAQAQGWGWSEAIHPDDRKKLVEEWQSSLVAGTPVDTEARIRGFDAAYRWFLIRANPLKDESGNILKWYGTCLDIEDRKRAEEKLRRSEDFLAEGQRLTLTGSYSWKVATDEITWSEQLYRIYDFDVGIPVTLELIRARLHPEDIGLIEKMKMVAQSEGAKDFEWHWRLKMPDDSIKYLHAVAHATRDRDDQLEYIAAVQDVTARYLSEKALAGARSELAKVARVTSLGVLTASIAHEVNQPLSGIITNASTCLRMLSAEPPNVDGARETARRTIRDGNRASDVITRLRTLYSKKDPQLELMDLSETAREVTSLSVSELQQNRVVLRQELAEDLPAVIGDRIQLQQVIMNLLRNASEAMSTVDRPRELLIRTELEEGNRVRLSVKDVGVGFEPQVLDKLFDAFFTTKSDGMGIGLSISRSIIDAHQGRLWATANSGPGATFSFSIPCQSKGSSGADANGGRDPVSDAA